MLGTPKQTPDSLEETFAFIARMQVTHISAYLLKIEPGTPFDRLQAKLALPEEDTVCQMYLQTVERLGQLALPSTRSASFARPGYESRHNLKYWLLEPYLGLGPSAHSLWNGRRFYFDRDWIWQDEGPGGDREEQILLGLRLNRGIPEGLAHPRSGAVPCRGIYAPRQWSHFPNPPGYAGIQHHFGRITGLRRSLC